MVASIQMPALSPTMTEGTIARWHKQVGDSVESGEVILEVETDKATMEVEAVDEGVLAKILLGDGSANVPVGTDIGLIQEDGDTGEDVEGFGVSSSSPETTPAPETIPKADQPQTKDPDIAAPSVHTAGSSSASAPISEPEPEWNGATMETTVREALRDAMAEEMRRDENVFLMGEEVAEYQGAYKVSQGLLEEFGDQRVIDTPITEYGFAGIGCGAAMAGLRPIVEFMTFNFAMQAIDHIINSAAKTAYMSGGSIRCPIVFRGPNGVASRVAAQHSQCYASWYGHCPGLKVVAPYTAADAKGLLKSAIRDPNPVVFLEHELVYGSKEAIPDSDDWLVPIGKARIVRTGPDVSLVSFSKGVRYCEQAAEALSEIGIQAEIIDLRSIRPIDWPCLIESLKKTNRMITVEEGWGMYGVGSEIAAELSHTCFDFLDAPITRISGKDVPMPYAANLEALALPNVEEIVSAARHVCYQEG